MKTSRILLCGNTLIATLFTLLAGTIAHAQAPSYSRMAPVEEYQMPRDAEIAMARTAAPDSISRDAEILVMGRNGYEVAAKGTNGFVCMVQRGFAAGIDDPVFWNPKIRGPICLNPEATRSFLPHITKKAEWVLAGQSKEQILEKIKAALNNGEFPAIGPGAMSYMMSKQGVINNQGGNWHPHLMFFTAAAEPGAWGANLPESPVLAATAASEGFTIFLVTVSKWSDGTPDAANR